VGLLVSQEPNATTEDSQRSVVQLSPGTVAAPVVRPEVTPIAPELFKVRFTMGQEMHDDLRSVQDLRPGRST